MLGETDFKGELKTAQFFFFCVDVRAITIFLFFCLDVRAITSEGILNCSCPGLQRKVGSCFDILYVRDQ